MNTVIIEKIRGRPAFASVWCGKEPVANIPCDAFQTVEDGKKILDLFRESRFVGCVSADDVIVCEGDDVDTIRKQMAEFGYANAFPAEAI